MFSLLLVVLIIGNFYAAFNGYRQGLDIAEQMLVERLHLKHEQLAQEIIEHDGDVDRQFVEETLYQFSRGGELLFASKNAQGASWAEPHPGLSFLAFNGARWRSYTADVAGGTLLVAERYDTYINMLEKLLVSAVLPLIWIIPVIGVAILVIIRIGLRPLNEMANALRQRSDTDFSPLHIDRPTQELSVVVQSLNSLLQKLGEAFDREQRFASYAAHELRSPITSMKLSLHNLAAMPEFKENSSYSALQHNLSRMQNTIEQLLLLAKIGDEKAMSSRERLSLQPLLAELIAGQYSRIEMRQQSIELGGDDVAVSANRFALEGALANVIDNAIKYTPEAGSLLVTVNRHKNGVDIVVEDSGPGIPEADLHRVFERFYRVGGDRHSSGVSGTGLGLSIVSQCLYMHDGQINL
ncbi:MAG TPA: ATP-binding protein, partial [Pseudomonadales bacterium]|nr:ATP-binding protein [Pseudomonadales bacterium]